MALRAQGHGKPFTEFFTDCVAMNAVDLNIILVSEIWHDSFQTAIRRECRLTTGGNDTRFHNLCFRTAVSQTFGSEVRPNLLEANLRNRADWKPVCFCQRNSLTRFGFGSERR